MGAGRDNFGDLRQMQIHCFGVAGRKNQGGTFAILWADRAEDVGRGGALIARSAWASAALGPAAGDLILLADTSLICEPDLYLVDVDRPFERNCLQTRGEVFLKSSTALAACAWWRGRADSLR